MPIERSEFVDQPLDPGAVLIGYAIVAAVGFVTGLSVGVVLMWWVLV